MFKEKISNFFSIAIMVIFFLVLASIVPNSFAISLIGFALCVFLVLLKNPNTLFDKTINKLNNKTFLIIFFSWVLLIIVAGCVNAWARFISPGYDLYWFTQAISQAVNTGILKTSSERLYKTILMQHWEPILYSAVPLTLFVKSSLVSILWQGLGFLIGSVGAFKLSAFLFKETNYPKAKYATSALYVLSFPTINPLSFDIHPPVFGGLLLIPWIIFCIVSNKNKFITIFLLLMLAQCGEIFLAVFTSYLAYFFVKSEISIIRVSCSFVIFICGYFILSYYQKYLGPAWSGLPYNYASRYGNIGGDGFGIIINFIQRPFYVLSQIFEKEKIKTFLKIFLYSGPFFILAFKSSKYSRLSFFILLGCIPYFLQAGLSSYNLLYATNTHYIGALGSQWWALSTIGLHAFLTEDLFINIKKLCFQTSLAGLIFIFFFLNSSEWRKSPIYPIRGLFERQTPAKDVRNYLSQLEKKKGILFIRTEWLCPLASFDRAWIICQDGSGYFDKMPLDVVVARKGSIEEYYNGLSVNLKNSDNGKKLKELIKVEKIASSSSSWNVKISSQQKPYKDKTVFYNIYESR